MPCGGREGALVAGRTVCARAAGIKEAKGYDAPRRPAPLEMRSEVAPKRELTQRGSKVVPVAVFYGAGAAADRRAVVNWGRASVPKDACGVVDRGGGKSFNLLWPWKSLVHKWCGFGRKRCAAEKKRYLRGHQPKWSAVPQGAA